MKETKTIFPHKSIFVRCSGETIKVSLSDINYIESDHDYLDIYTANRRLTVHSTMLHIYTHLDPHRFVPCHRSFIVNLEKITKLTPGFLYVAGKQIPIGEKYKEQVLDRLNIL